MIESTITKIEYLTSRQVASCENGDLAKRNLNLLPVRARATFCHPFKISLRIKINKRKRTAIFNPVKFSIILLSSPSPLRSAQGKLNPLPQGRGDKRALHVILTVRLCSPSLSVVEGSVAKNLIFISLYSE